MSGNGWNTQENNFNVNTLLSLQSLAQIHLLFSFKHWYHYCAYTVIRLHQGLFVRFYSGHCSTVGSIWVQDLSEQIV